MPRVNALSDAEILAALPEEHREKINNAFEGLTQQRPSTRDQAVLYRVVHTLKLNPTDTVFSVLAALHYYLQLYEKIPEKIGELRHGLNRSADGIRVAIENSIKAESAQLIEELRKARPPGTTGPPAQQQLNLLEMVTHQRKMREIELEREKAALKNTLLHTVIGVVMFAAGIGIGAKELSPVWTGTFGISLGIFVGAGVVILAYKSAKNRHLPR